MKSFKEFLEGVKEPTGDLKKACWTGYTAVGMKMKNGRKVPNCVPIKEESETKDYTDAGEVKAAIGAAKFNAMVKSEPFQAHRRMHFANDTPTTYSVTDHGYHHRVEVSTHPYLTVFHIGQAKRGPAKVSSYHHMVAHPDEPKKYVTIKTHGYDDK